MTSHTETTPPSEAQPRQGRAIRPRLALLLSGAAILAALGLAVGLLLAFSGGGGETGGDAEEYLRGAAALLNDIDDRTGSGEVASATDVFVFYAAILQETAGDLAILTPPSELADAHEELVEALGLGGARILSLADEHPDVSSFDEVDSIVAEDAEVAEADGRVRAACTELQELADKEEFDIDFELC